MNQFQYMLDMLVIASDSHLHVGVASVEDAKRVYRALHGVLVDDCTLVVKHDVEDGNPYEVIATAEDLL
jgi:hypothetical protein